MTIDTERGFIYGDGGRRSYEAHTGKNRRRVFVAGKYVGTERLLRIPGGKYASWDHAREVAENAPPPLPAPKVYAAPTLGPSARVIRPGQAAFRKAVLARDGGCVVTGTPADARIYSKGKAKAIIQAAHIKPLKLCGPDEYWDLDNGLAMRSDIHAAFDHGLFTIGDDGEIIASRWMAEYYPEKITVELTEGQRRYLEGHRGWTVGNWSRWAFFEPN